MKSWKWEIKDGSEKQELKSGKWKMEREKWESIKSTKDDWRKKTMLKRTFIFKLNIMILNKKAISMSIFNQL